MLVLENLSRYPLFGFHVHIVNLFAYCYIFATKRVDEKVHQFEKKISYFG